MPPGMEELFFDFARRVETLTPMERTVLQYYINGFSVNEIAEKEFISLSTVRKHNSNINRKLGVSTRESCFFILICSGGVILWRRSHIVLVRRKKGQREQMSSRQQRRRNPRKS